jgi:hypothetical protein
VFPQRQVLHSYGFTAKICAKRFVGVPTTNVLHKFEVAKDNYYENGNSEVKDIMRFVYMFYSGIYKVDTYKYIFPYL